MRPSPRMSPVQDYASNAPHTTHHTAVAGAGRAWGQPDEPSYRRDHQLLPSEQEGRAPRDYGAPQGYHPLGNRVEFMASTYARHVLGQ